MKTKAKAEMMTLVDSSEEEGLEGRSDHEEGVLPPQAESSTGTQLNTLTLILAFGLALPFLRFFAAVYISNASCDGIYVRYIALNHLVGSFTTVCSSLRISSGM